MALSLPDIASVVNDLEPMCSLCGCREHAVVERSTSLYRVLQCNGCGVKFVHPQPGDEVLASAYDEDYYAEWEEGQREVRGKLWQRRLRDLERLVPEQGKLLDVGCGLGRFLEVAKRSGWQVAGTEFSGVAAEKASKRIGERVFCGQLDAAGMQADRFDAITLWHVLEHVRDPLALLKECARVLKPGGVVIIGVPNSEARIFHLVYRIVKGRQEQLFDPEAKELHLFHFSARALEVAARSAGFTVQSITVDGGQATMAKRVLDWIARIVSKVVHRTWYSALRAVCYKDGKAAPMSGLP